jgi:alpha-L-fucosidase
MRKNADFIKADKDRDLTKYREYLFAQTKELLTRFGKIDILWYDFSVADSEEFKGKGKDVWDSENLIKMIRQLQPDIILDDRLQIDQDIKTPEQYQPREWVKVDGQKVVWEACQTFSGSWGYYRDEYTWKSTEMLIKMLVDSVSKGGNLLLNVGPTGRGEFDDRALTRLKEIGSWMKYNSKSIYGCTQAPDGFTVPEDCRLTYDPAKNRLYLHVFNWPFKHIHFDGLTGKIEYAQFLHDASEISYVENIKDSEGVNTAMRNKADSVTFTLPIEKPNIVPVIEIFLKDKA